MNRTLEPKERALTIDIYDVPGRPVCRKCIQPFLSSTSLPVLVFNISDDKSCDAVIDDVNYMRTKLPRTPLILVGLHADRILNEETRRAKCTEIQDAIKEQTKNLIQDLEEELKTFRETTTSGKAETRLIRERIAWIEKRMEELSNETTVIIPASTVTTKVNTRFQESDSSPYK
ncbi:hypothetical protein HOLleu_04910 [Holothuria leucospilota]|uniref:Uncharacterized protein n=1 Tax=Holothuria leucospilota TaxID=206669 RepID=A0A9Q1HH24_HOLLE|nr:hypothetical protein HOLleu_04910 [Holothuria leucospilota]